MNSYLNFFISTHFHSFFIAEERIICICLVFSRFLNFINFKGLFLLKIKLNCTILAYIIMIHAYIQEPDHDNYTFLKYTYNFISLTLLIYCLLPWFHIKFVLIS